MYGSSDKNIYYQYLSVFFFLFFSLVILLSKLFSSQVLFSISDLFYLMNYRVVINIDLCEFYLLFLKTFFVCVPFVITMVN